MTKWKYLDYEQKKEQCRKRLISFEFTKDQWISLMKLQHKVTCAYTNCSFIFTKGHKYSPSLERLDCEGPYSPNNCVWVTKQANLLKANYIETKGDESKLSIDESSALVRIKRVVSSVENIKEVQKPYKHLFNIESSETHSDKINSKEGQSFMTHQKTSSQASEKTQTALYIPENQEITLCHKYASFGKFIEQTCQTKFLLTYTQFKVKLNRKNCTLTGKPIREVGYFIPNKSNPVDKNNFIIVEKSVGEAVDKLSVECSMDFKGMKALCKNFGKL